MTEMSATTTIDSPQVQQPTGIHDLPPEILASAFETIIYTSCSDISLILPLTLVCRAWHDLITYTPRLWGILSLHRHTHPWALAKRIARAKAAPLSITADTRTHLKDWEMKKQIKSLAGLVRNWCELDVGVEFLVAACELDRNRDREQEHELGSLEPIGCEPTLGWVDMYRSVHSLTLARGQRGHETPGAFFTHGGGVPSGLAQDVKLHSFTSVSLPKKWIMGFLGPSIKTLRLLRGERATNPWPVFNASTSSDSFFLGIEDLLIILSRIPNATHIELERVVWSSPYLPVSSFSPNGRVIQLPFLRDLALRGVLYTSLILAVICAPALQTLSVDRTDRTWDEPLAPVFAQWTQPGFVMENLHTLELINCLRREDEIPYLIRWLGKMKSLVRLFITEESESLSGLEDEEDGNKSEETNLFKALASPWISDHGSERMEWLCPLLMILHVDLPDTPIRTLISIARDRGGIVPCSYPSPPSSGGEKASSALMPSAPPGRLRSIETRLCAAAAQADIDALKSLVDNPRCICMNCALYLPLESLTVSDV